MTGVGLGEFSLPAGRELSLQDERANLRCFHPEPERLRESSQIPPEAPADFPGVPVPGTASGNARGGALPSARPRERSHGGRHSPGTRLSIGRNASLDAGGCGGPARTLQPPLHHLPLWQQPAAADRWRPSQVFASRDGAAAGSGSATPVFFTLSGFSRPRTSRLKNILRLQTEP